MKHNHIAITCLGDIAPIKVSAEAILADIQSKKDYLDKLFADSDIVFGNLETPITTRNFIRENKKYNFKTNNLIINSFPDKFVFSIANNHILDYGYEGLFETIGHLSTKKIRFCGAGRNIEDAAKPVIIECKGRKIGFLAAADKRYQAATKSRPGIMPADLHILNSAIRNLNNAVDIIYLSIHMGMEYISIPAPAMMQLSRLCHQAGAHVVFFHHAHCVSGYTVSNNYATLWGVGNFIFPESESFCFKPWFETAAWTFTHPLFRNNIKLNVRPFIINYEGFPEEADAQTRKKILARIDFLNKRINTGKNITWLRIKNMLNIGYIKLLISNYSDIGRRKGLVHLLNQIYSSLKVLFLKK